MDEDWKSAFDHYGVKTVTKTDKGKGAFVPNAEQRDAMSSAGFEPGAGGENAIRLIVEVLSDPDWDELDTSYYSSMRHGTGRIPEARMGRDFIHWADIGDEIAIGSIGDKVYAWKENRAKHPLSEIASKIASTADEEDVLERARSVKGKPQRKTKTVSDFRRSLAVVAGALSRSEGLCEMPGCTTLLFKKDGGLNFLEVHHVVPLAENGEDTMANAAALCPMCHRELHYGIERMTKRQTLKEAVLQKET